MAMRVSSKRCLSSAWPWLGVFVLLLSFGHDSVAEAQEELPFEAQVSSNIAAVHAAPSNKAYATDTLRKGTIVEVYRIDPGGWWAVRPPLGSFSILATDALEPTEDPMVARVIRDGVKVWVGTRVSEKDTPLWQVKLTRGELVELLVAWPERNQGSGNADAWTLIQPPAGEFRWIHERELRRETTPRTAHVPNAPFPAVVTTASSTTASPTTASSTTSAPIPGTTPASPLSDSATTSPTNAVPTSPAASPGSSSGSGAPESGRWQRVDGDAGAASSGGAGASSSAPDSAAPSTAPPSSAPAAAIPVPSSLLGNPPFTSGTSFDERLRQVETWFDAQLIGQPMVGSERLEAALALLDREATQSKDRETLRQLRDRYGRWRELDLRRQALERLASQPRGSLAQAGTIGVDGADPAVKPGDWRSELPRIGEGLAALAGNNPQASGGFVAQGTLSRLIRSGGLQPSSYALQDASGKVVALVVPSPGMNLERYLKQEVGVVGTSSSNPALSMPTVVAERVVELERHR